MIISRTPYRISFFGGGTDYPAWYLKHGGQVLSTTIDKYLYISCRYLPPFFEHRLRLVYSQIEMSFFYLIFANRAFMSFLGYEYHRPSRAADDADAADDEGATGADGNRPSAATCRVTARVTRHRWANC